MSCSGPAEPLWGSCVHFSTLPWGKASSLLEAFVLAFISRKKPSFWFQKDMGTVPRTWVCSRLCWMGPCAA